jgi:hypothetical protein
MKLTLRQLLYPLICLAYRLDSKDKRGAFLVPFQHVDHSNDSVEVYFGRIPGWRYGSFRLESKPPRLIVSRKDGVQWEHDFLKDTTSVLEITNTAFVLHRADQPPFVLCQCRSFYMFQLVTVWSRMPAEVKPRLRLSFEETPES